MGGKIRCEMMAEFGDDYLDLKIRMDGFPEGVTKEASKNHGDLTRVVQEAIIKYMGSKIDHVETHGLLTSDEPISEDAINSMRKSIREKDPTLN
jgi:hypothetical protein